MLLRKIIFVHLCVCHTFALAPTLAAAADPLTAAPRRSIDLGAASWTFAGIHGDGLAGDLHDIAGLPAHAWQPARVPGNVRLDLARNRGMTLQQLYTDSTLATPAWQDSVDGKVWWYRCDFRLHSSQVRATRLRAILRFHGIDYISQVFFNGEALNDKPHEGVFSWQEFDVTELLDTLNTVFVRMPGAGLLPGRQLTSLQRWAQRRGIALGYRNSLAPYHDRHATLKMQMGFGWDFAPKLRTTGIWDRTELLLTRGPFIHNLFVRTIAIDADRALLRIESEIDATAAAQVQVRGIIRDTAGALAGRFSQRRRLTSGNNSFTAEVEIAAPRLWHPWDQGPSHLYTLQLVVEGSGGPLDSKRQHFGIRRLSNAGEIANGEIRLQINGRPAYLRGMNWVPVELFPGLADSNRYAELIALAKAANTNMLRVWGGGLREKQAFYDICDREGMLVWQEFPISVALADELPNDPAYLELLQMEATAIVRQLRNHPSLVLWCGGNEFSARRSQPAVAVMRRTVAQEDSTRPFLPASPHGGDQHIWQVWHIFHSIEDYRKRVYPFVSEFGLQALPVEASLRQMVPGIQWPFTAVDSARLIFRHAQFEKLQRYLPAGETVTGPVHSLASYIAASQQAQAHGLQTAVEHFRRSKAAGNGGVIPWQFNEPWPAVSWSVVDYARRPKLGYFALQQAFQPILVSLLDYAPAQAVDDSVRAQVWLVNDTDRSERALRVELRAGDATGALLAQLDSLALAPFSARAIGTVLLPAGAHQVLALLRGQNGELLSQNSYDLRRHDPLATNFWNRQAAAVGWMVTTAGIQTLILAIGAALALGLVLILTGARRRRR